MDKVDEAKELDVGTGRDAELEAPTAHTSGDPSCSAPAVMDGNSYRTVLGSTLTGRALVRALQKEPLFFKCCEPLDAPSLIVTQPMHAHADM